MKKILVTLVLFPLFLFAGNDKKFAVGINAGLSLPTGEYGGKDPSTIPARNFIDTQGPQQQITANGYANIGGHFDIGLSYKATSFFLIMVYVGGNINSFDIETLRSQTQSYYSESNTTLQANFNINKSYYVGQYLIGGYFNIPFGDSKLGLEITALGGINTISFPTPTNTLSNAVFSGTVTNGIQLKNTSGIGYLLSGGLKLNTKSIIYHLNIGYSGSEMTIPGYTIYSTYIPTPGTKVGLTGNGTGYSESTPEGTNIKTSINMLQFSIGISVPIF